VGGLLIGQMKQLSGAMNPIITCTVVANAGAAVLGVVNGAGYFGVLKAFKTGAAFTGTNLGALAGGVLRTRTRPTSSLLPLLRMSVQASTLKVSHAPILVECLFSMTLLAGLRRHPGRIPRQRHSVLLLQAVRGARHHPEARG